MTFIGRDLTIRTAKGEISVIMRFDADARVVSVLRLRMGLGHGRFIEADEESVRTVQNGRILKTYNDCVSESPSGRGMNWRVSDYDNSFPSG